ncbi:acylphosphatase [Staphylococcus saccharolyticus]|jgi:acylphosphatase|uniref:acylphosphatase n=1 Tax=Staphylococcus saccharolyticus TaxID=33028 RepID=A0A380H6V7_9STAP|nr:acylphosphatase [Staphylococcus saccharolyticus]MBL7565294.1 acylphosphatase [Staphylococcus saccharolyticus]MBL7571648.1 acylphosphatase [Staphylococcus saccharolyticus]QQB98161.1 acylphosphatase [Staphylococcus saccharolyticus]QRJ65987.1 acylphosphatase [Staphylococcus saccharolyticus]RTX95961.1 acylphosphatase [Staphylococcus saccharolyticus]
MQRKHIQVFGNVRGVGFRFYTARIANQYDIKGTVQNVDDYVDIYAQGENEALYQFTQSVIEGASPASSVSTYNIEDLNVDELLTEFKTI